MKYRDYAYYAYTAGVIDGDGSIAIEKQPCRREGWSPTYSLRIEVFMKDGRVVDFLTGFWGGKVHYDKSKRGYVWRLYTDKAMECLKRIHPFLRYKRDQADLAIEYRLFHRRIIEAYRHQHNSRREGLSNSVLDKLEDYRQRLSALKHVYETAKALATTKRDDVPMTERSDSLTSTE